jgi:hypothetical protein
MISKLLPCLFSQSSPLKEVQVSVLVQVTGAQRGSRTHAMWPSLQDCGGARRVVPGEHAYPSRYQPIQPLFDIGVAVATGDSSLIRGTPCRHTIQLADMLAGRQLGSSGVQYSRLAPLIKRFQCFSTTEKRDRSQSSKRSLSHLMVNGDTCPTDFESLAILMGRPLYCPIPGLQNPPSQFWSNRIESSLSDISCH